MTSTKKAARTAGLLYLVASVPGAFSLLYVPSRFMVRGDAAATASRILSAQWLFRLGILSEVVGFTGFIFVVLALYRLLKGVNQGQASLMVVLMLVSIPISLVNVLNEFAALELVSGGGFLTVFNERERDALAMLFLRLHFHGIMVAQIFWGLWLVPFGTLVIRSKFLPKILGVLLIVASVGYLAGTLEAWELLPYGGKVLPQLTACELPIILWRLIVGARDQPLSEAA